MFCVDCLSRCSFFFAHTFLSQRRTPNTLDSLSQNADGVGLCEKARGKLYTV